LCKINGERICFNEALPSGVPFRWSGPGKVSTLDVPIQRDRDLTPRNRGVDADAQQILDNLRLAVNNHPLAFRPWRGPADPSQTGVFEAHVPSAILEADKPFAHIEFSVSHAKGGSGTGRHAGSSFARRRCLLANIVSGSDRAGIPGTMITR
jgi:hypothetical protein